MTVSLKHRTWNSIKHKNGSTSGRNHKKSSSLTVQTEVCPHSSVKNFYNLIQKHQSCDLAKSNKKCFFDFLCGCQSLLWMQSGPENSYCLDLPSGQRIWAFHFVGTKQLEFPMWQQNKNMLTVTKTNESTWTFVLSINGQAFLGTANMLNPLAVKRWFSTIDNKIQISLRCSGICFESLYASFLFLKLPFKEPLRLQIHHQFHLLSPQQAFQPTFHLFYRPRNQLLKIQQILRLGGILDLFRIILASYLRWNVCCMP